MKKTPVNDFHESMGAQMVDFAGWSMPLKYTSVIEEHNQCRNAGAVFDVSHMGRVAIKGLHAKRLLERTCSRRIGNMKPNRCRYSLICNEAGGVKDDVIVYCNADDDFMVVVNASNREKILAHWQAVAAEREFQVSIEDQTEKTAMLAAQGPGVMEVIKGVSQEIPSLKRYQFTVKNLMVIKVTVSRTGYTGEDGVEVIVPAGAVPMLMKIAQSKMDPKKPDSPLKPAGLAARDSLRVEAGMPLYGHELGEDINALACGVDFAISLDKSADDDGETFIGQEALLSVAKAGGPSRKLMGLELDGRRTARQGAKVLKDGREIGGVSSGCLSPTLGKSIAMAFIDKDEAALGDTLVVPFGSGDIAATVVDLPFYKRPQ